MIDFVSAENYTPFFYYVNLVLVFLVVLRNLRRPELLPTGKIGLIVVWAIILFMGLRPIESGFFGDTGAYLRVFRNLVDGGTTDHFEQDFGFNIFMKWSTKWMSEILFFLVCSFMYVFSQFIVAKKLFDNYWYYGFLILFSSFSFWPYGTNGIRNGLAASIVMLAFSFEKNKILALIFSLIGVSFHKTMLLPVLAFYITYYYNDPKIFLRIWLLSIPLSLVAGGAFEGLFASLGFEDDRLGYLVDGNVNDDEFAYTGFRWDFLIYSATAVYAGWYFIIKKGFEDNHYIRLFNVYLLANAFWVLVIRANFSNRFAYLSWFMIGLIIIYPFLKKEFMPNQTRKTLLIVVLYYAFTFLFNVLLAKK